MKNRHICLLTLAKGESKRLENKNMRIFKGKPLLYWTIKKALKITKDYFVNSDDDEILEFAKKNGANIIRRNKKYLDHEVPSRIIMNDSFKDFPKRTDAVIHVQANSPNLETDKLKKIYQIMKYTEVDDIFSLTSDHKINGSFWGITKKKLKKYDLNHKLHDHLSLKNQCWFIDDTIDIHYIKEFKQAERRFSKEKLY